MKRGPRWLAQQAGLPKYETGKPCKNGHISARCTKTALCLACVPAHHAANYRKHVGEKRLTRQAYYRSHAQDWRDRAASNAAHILEIRRLRYKRSPEKFLAVQSRRRFKLGLSADHFTPDDVQALVKRQKGKCAHSWCRTPFKGRGYHIDHIMPLALGGSNGRRNIQLLCKPCNVRKQAKHPIDHAQKHGMLL